MTKTARLGLPLLEGGQAQKEITHNEALVLIDALLHARVAGISVNAEPTDPAPGDCYLVGPNGQGAFAAAAENSLAIFSDGGWRFVTPRAGMHVADGTGGGDWRFDGSQWLRGVGDFTEVRVDGQKVLAGRQPTINPPMGGQFADMEARGAIQGILGAMREHGLIET